MPPDKANRVSICGTLILFQLCSESSFDLSSHKADRGKVMNFYPISFSGVITLLPSAVLPIKLIWAEDSKHKRRQTGAHIQTHVTTATHGTHMNLLKIKVNVWAGISELNIHTKMHRDAFTWTRTHTYTHIDTKGRRGSDRTDCLFQSLQRAYWFFPHSSFYTPPSHSLASAPFYSKGTFIFFFPSLSLSCSLPFLKPSLLLPKRQSVRSLPLNLRTVC